MSNGRESGIGGRESDPSKGSLTEAAAPTPHPPLPTPPNWPLLYSAVLAELVILIILFYSFTKAFA